MAANKKVQWSYDDVYGLAQNEGLWDSMSDADRQLAQSDPDTAMSILNHKIGYRDASSDADRAYHHAAAQNDRKSAGYTGDNSGSGYYQVRRFSYGDAPSYTSKYQSQIDALANQILNRAAFSYDKNNDPQYAAYKKEYAREGRRASEDALGQAAALTGGMPSTAAMVASQQAGDYYAAKMADKIPELYQLAYDMYLKEGDQQRANMSMLQALEEGDYNKYLNALKQYNTDRDFAYGQYSDDYSRDYQEERDKIADALTEREYQTALAKLGAQYGDYAGLRGLGINPYADLMDAAYGSSSSSSSRSPKGSDDGSPSGNDNNNNNADDNDNGSKKVELPDWYLAQNEDWARSLSNRSLPSFTTQKQAADYLKSQGVSAQYANRVLSEDDWRRRKQESPGSAEAAYRTYASYLQDWTEYILDTYKTPGLGQR